MAQRTTPTVRIGRATVTLPPGAFLQATALGEETLARLVLGHVGSAKAVADLFAGVGPFALRLAERARVLAADSDAGAIDALREMGLAVPADVAVVGFDNWGVMTEAARPALTSVDMNLEVLGREAGALLLEMMGGRALKGVRRLPCSLVIRDSCGARQRAERGNQS